ncbi:MAG TPA: pyridoxal phosphate-dependent aminotransferase [Fimbriimonadaceae bacterium]|nr:pyridoxal phosphate-dependent aminotransferase [Fimbriimonadaceae bacterium]
MKSLSLSARAGQLKPSPTLGISARAQSMRAQGIDVISLAAGEPDFPTPEPICDAAIAALRAGFTKYTPTPGILELRQAIAEKLWAENSVRVAPEQVIVSSGAKQSLFNSCNILLDPGDEVILIAPYWMTYAEQVMLAGGVPVKIQTTSESGFVPTSEQLREAVSPRTKAIIINSPSNPTGAVLSRQILKGIAALAIRHDFWVIADEIYEKLIYGAEHVSIASLGSEIAERTVTIGGCSKTFAMTGWRVGFAAAPLPVAKAMSNFQDQVTSNANSFAQKGAVKAFTLGGNAVEEMRVEYESRRNLVVGLLREIPDVTVNVPSGAFYAMPNVSAYLGGRFATDLELAEYLLDEGKVATVPGSVFEGHGHIRLSYAASRENLQTGIARISDALQKLRA